MDCTTTKIYIWCKSIFIIAPCFLSYSDFLEEVLIDNPIEINDTNAVNIKVATLVKPYEHAVHFASASR